MREVIGDSYVLAAKYKKDSERAVAVKAVLWKYKCVNGREVDMG
jgi:hypothetical protein